MADQDKKITELQLISTILSSQMFPLDNGIQTYRATIAQLKTFLAPIYIPFSTQKFLTGSGTYYKSRAFVVSGANATVGATYTHNSVTWTVTQTVASANIVYMWGNGSPLVAGTLTKSGGTGDSTIAFTEYRDPIQIRVRMAGGGACGSGGSAATSNNGGNGTAGNSSTFGSSLLTAAGGGFNPGSSESGSAGGDPTVNAPAIDLGSVKGQKGGSAQWTQSGLDYPVGGTGGSNPGFGGGGPGGCVATGGAAGMTNTGSGGGGGGTTSTTSIAKAGTGGGSGAFVHALIPNPSVSYAYVVAAAISGPVGGTNGNAGGGGGAGQIIVEEIYQ